MIKGVLSKTENIYFVIYFKPVWLTSVVRKRRGRKKVKHFWINMSVNIMTQLSFLGELFLLRLDFFKSLILSMSNSKYVA